VNIIGAQADSDGSLDPWPGSRSAKETKVDKPHSGVVACTKLSHRSIVVQDSSWLMARPRKVLMREETAVNTQKRLVRRPTTEHSHAVGRGGREKAAKPPYV
jgi:hypothetical protein